MFPRLRPGTRIARFLAKGYPAQVVAAIEKPKPREMKALLGEHGFRGPIGWFRRLHVLPPRERLERLVRHAMEVLEELLRPGNPRAGAFILAENRAGRHPVDTLARRDAVPAGSRPGRRPRAPSRSPTLAPGSGPDTRQLCRDVEFRELVATSDAQNSTLHKLDEPATAPANPPRLRAGTVARRKPGTGPLPPFVPGMAVGLGTRNYAARGSCGGVEPLRRQGRPTLSSHFRPATGSRCRGHCRRAIHASTTCPAGTTVPGVSRQPAVIQTWSPIVTGRQKKRKCGSFQS